MNRIPRGLADRREGRDDPDSMRRQALRNACLQIEIHKKQEVSEDEGETVA